MTGEFERTVGYKINPQTEQLEPISSFDSGAKSSLNGFRLNQHYSQLEKYGTAGYKDLQNGRIRYYGESTVNKFNDNYFRMVREWDPSTNLKRTWFETLNSQKQIIQVRPEFGNGVKIHYRFDNNGNYIGKW
ncbi:hypothetical protein MTP09_08085 [Chryseobacterium suipulveris]|uniref:Uncharacterized protein n=1 Tax=Chryseobacterium suipulveris TaxID=2929800 RepID=A0ABY4BLA9_9FLAO|nr:hypothetical protein [Chryseobacterium suipulveris]UOE39885.1 hypothetical protein MTP09_08085 [Chryseobacterium suipulveris]